MQALFLKEAVGYNVLPIDDRTLERMDPGMAGRPNLMGKRTSLTLYAGMTGSLAYSYALDSQHPQWKLPGSATMSRFSFLRTLEGRRLFAAALLTACLCSPLYAKRRDVVVMKNGDHITGEVKKLEHGQLFIEVEYVAGEVVALDWLQVAKVESIARYRVRLQDGTQLTGAIEKVPEEEAPREDFRIEEAGSRARVSAPEVVEIQSQKKSFWRQLKGSVDFGQSYTSGNGQRDFNVDATANYLSTKYLLQGSLSTAISGQTDAAKTNRNEISFLGGRFLSRNDLVLGYLDFLHSNQQSLDLRTTVGGGYGRYLINSNRTQLTALGGMVFTKEQYSPSSGLDSNKQSVEGLIGLQYATFQVNKVEFQTSFQLFPGISDAGRIRSNLNSSLTLKLVHDFHLKFSFWDTYDSKPPVNAKKNELGVSTTFGVSF